RGLGVRVYDASRYRAGGFAVWRLVPRPGSIDTESELEHYRLQRVVKPVHAAVHVVDSIDLRTTCHGVPGLDVLGSSPTDLRRADTSIDRPAEGGGVIEAAGSRREKTQ